MGEHLRIEIRDHLDERVLAEVRALVEAATAAAGDGPLGEEKHAHLRVGAERWVGILAYRRGELVGYAHTRWNPPGTTPRLAAETVVHPEDREEGIARGLLLEVRAVLGRAGGGVLWLWAHRVQDASRTLAARLGLAVQRELAYMTRTLEVRPEIPELPPGVELRAFRPGVDDAALLEVNNAAFRGHPEQGGWDAADLAARTARDWFDPAGLLLAWRGEELLGFHWTKWHGAESDEATGEEPAGEVYVLGIAPAAQGLGLGRTLLLAGLAHLHDRGARQALLYVDGASAPAVALYESEGFRAEHREVCYADEVAQVVDHRGDPGGSAP